MRRFWEIVIEPALTALGPRTIVEVGSDAGGNTKNLLDFCEKTDAKLHVIDPLPKYEVSELRERYGDRLVFHEDLSLNALPRIEEFDAVLIDGDHNWYTVMSELRLIREQCEKLSRPFPLIMLHDIGWPYGRRDLYYDPGTIPEEHCKPYEKKGMRPDSEELLEGKGLNQHLDNATGENEPLSGVLTAVEDFMEETHYSLELVTIPGLHGLGLLFPENLTEENAKFAEALDALSLPETAARLVERVERERIETLISRQELRDRLIRLRERRDEEVEELRKQLASKEAELEEARRHPSTTDAHRQLENLQQTLSNREERVAALERQLDQRSRDVDRLYRWLKQMDNGLTQLLDSRQWKLGRRLEGLRQRALRRPAGPPMPENLTRARQRFRAWRREYEDQQASAEPSQAPPSPEPERSSSEPELKKTAQRHRHFGAPEHILESLRNLEPVTVLVPVYNAAEDLESCLEALVRNTTAPAKLLLIDDASPDPRIAPLLEEYKKLENVRVLTNEENLGFVRTVNRGFAGSSGDVVLLNSDAEVTPRWLENLTLAAHADPRTATVTAISDNAGAFSMPEIGKKNETPELAKGDVGRLVTQCSAQIYPQSPTGNGFCMFVKRAALDDVGLLDAESFPRGYGEENDFCMRAMKRGWNNIVDDATFVFHERTASFGETKQEIYERARAKLDELHPEYSQLARSFVGSEDMKRVGENVRSAYRSLEPGQKEVRPRILFVLHHASGGTPHTNRDLMEAVSDRYDPYLLTSNAQDLKLYRLEADGLILLEEWSLRSPQQPTEFTRPDYREIVFDLLTKYRFELVHIRHLVGHTFDLPEVAATLRIPVVLSFHDFYFSCPTVHLIDDNGRFCGGNCTPGTGRQCTILAPRLKNLPVLKHAWLGTWRLQVERMFDHVDAFVTTSNAAKEVYLRSLPVLNTRPFEVIEHGRDLEQANCASPPEDGPIRLLIPGNVDVHKGARFIWGLKEVDTENKIELHFLGNVEGSYRELGVFHGVYERGEFNDRVRQIAPSFMGIFSIWPETYCHTLTEAWAAGIPVLASDIGTLRERVSAHGGGWLLDHEDPEGSYQRILEIAADRQEYERELKKANLHSIRSTKQMSDDYEALYEALVRERRRFRPRAASASTKA